MKSIITFFMSICLIGIFSMSCSRKTAAWHLQKAKEKDPSLFEVTTDTIYREIPATTTIIPTDSISEDPFVLFLPVMDSTTGRIDTVTIELTETVYQRAVLGHEDSVAIHKALKVKVDCPDCEDIIHEVEVPVPVEPTFRDKLKWVGSGIGIGFLLFLVAMVLRRMKVI